MMLRNPNRVISATRKLAFPPYALAGLALSLGLALLSFAQSLIHQTGTVTDFSGASLQGVQVTLENEQTGQTFHAVSATNGTYSVDLPPGMYSVLFSSPGFGRGDFHHVPIPHPEGVLPLIVKLAPLPPPPPPGHGPGTVRLPTASSDGSSFPPADVAGGYTTGRAFLVSSEDEQEGFGLYSYLLLPSAPVNEEERKRDLAVISAFVQALENVSALGSDRASLNVTYLLLLEHPAKDKPEADWVLSRYDHARAKRLLRLFGQRGQDILNGPYVASVQKPLSHASGLSGPYLWQDMSHAADSLAAAWEKEFETRALQKEFWAPDTRNQDLLKFRDFIADAAAGLGVVGSSVESFKSSLGTLVFWGKTD